MSYNGGRHGRTPTNADEMEKKARWQALESPTGEIADVYRAREGLRRLCELRLSAEARALVIDVARALGMRCLPGNEGGAGGAG